MVEKVYNNGRYSAYARYSLRATDIVGFGRLGHSYMCGRHLFLTGGGSKYELIEEVIAALSTHCMKSS